MQIGTTTTQDEDTYNKRMMHLDKCKIDLNIMVPKRYMHFICKLNAIQKNRDVTKEERDEIEEEKTTTKEERDKCTIDLNTIVEQGDTVHMQLNTIPKERDVLEVERDGFEPVEMEEEWDIIIQMKLDATQKQNEARLMGFNKLPNIINTIKDGWNELEIKLNNVSTMYTRSRANKLSSVTTY